MLPSDLIVHDVTMTDTVTFGPGLPGQRAKRVQYYVGKNGPFFDTYSSGDFTTENVQAGIAKNVAMVKATLEAYPGTA